MILGSAIQGAMEAGTTVRDVSRGEKRSIRPGEEGPGPGLPRSGTDPSVSRREDLSDPAELPESPWGAGIEDDTHALQPGTPPRPIRRARRPSPSFAQDTDLWIWLWVIGGIVVLAIIIVAVASLP